MLSRDIAILLLLFAGIVGFLLVSLWPYNPDFSKPLRFSWFFLTPLNGVLNYLCFIPFGLLIANLSFVDRPILIAGVCCALLSGVVEFLQIFIPVRYASISDLVLNTSGGITGAYLITSRYFS